MKISKVRMGLIFISVLIVSSILGIVFWSTLRDTIVIPVYYLIWVAGLILKSISQNVYLTLLCLGLLGVSLHTVRTLRGKKTNLSQENNIHRETSRYIYWMKLLASSPKSEYYRLKFEAEARRLILSIFAYQEGLEPAEVEQKITQDEITVPPTVQRLIEKQDWRIDAYRTSWFEKLQHKVRLLCHKTNGMGDQTMTEGLEEIIHYIEDRLEITHHGNIP